ncbi:uncharacterized protein UV8b_01521 [Ustilaginoidea virens]|uniref:Uncharacterized protein n=1 Tax=Ustilaginoidea virens TaxID=1159556 RepID=A0A063BZP1_USTVR|nr:uncharacterized protein UV8b_01521 [Ustilaginoidea virens]QUC17280.1 hypothetical protein UV8b_01521 [Ustilaginoidea virens]GAO15665.1 hypothetical protein UVI_02019200 [Ustilaginoidea virens]
MAPKRPLDSGELAPEAKKLKRGFRVGPDNLPDGAWRRKVTKIKKDLIHKAKVKKQYGKIKAREQQKSPAGLRGEDADDDGADSGRGMDGQPNQEEEDEQVQIHPARELMLKDEEMAQAGATAGEATTSDGSRRRTRRPGYYDKQLQKAEERRKEKEERELEFQRRGEERERKLAERQRFKKAMARTVGRDGKKKLGRESAILLDKVKRLMADK